MTINAALSLIAPGQSCMLTLRVFRHADGRTDKPRLVASTDGQTWAAYSLADLIEKATRDREPAECDEILRELETVS